MDLNDPKGNPKTPNTFNIILCELKMGLTELKAQINKPKWAQMSLDELKF